MSDINLLPQELRKREQQEQARPAEHKSTSVYSKPSVLEERLREAEAADVSWWSKIKNWFNKYPEPTKELTEPIKLTQPVQDQRVKLTTVDFKVKKESNLADWWKNFFGSWKKETVTTSAPSKPVKPAVPLPIPLVPQPTPSASQPEQPAPVKPQHSHHDKFKKSSIEPEPPIGVVLDVNLLPVSSQPSKLGPYLKKILLVAGGSLVMVALLYVVVYTLINRQKVEVKKVQEEARMLVTEIDKKRSGYDELELVSRKMKAIKQVAAQRNDWLKFFSELQKITLSNVSFSSLQASGSGEIALQAQAFTVADLAKQLKSFQQADKMIASVAIGSISVSEDVEAKQVTVGTSFRIELTPGWLASQ
ncbi:MAG: hypothetical protein WC575_00670 [Patescibacteria group bacterium]